MRFGGLEIRPQQQRITWTLKLVGERFYPNSPNILLILLICRKTNIKNVSFSGNQLCEVNCSTLELFLNIRK